MWKRQIYGMIVLLFFLSSNNIYAKDVEMQSKHILVIVVPSFSFEEAHLLVDKEEQVFKQASIGAMNVRPEGPYSYLNNMVTLSAGNKATGILDWNGFEKGDLINGIDIREWMFQTAGELPYSEIYHPRVNELQKKNSDQNELIKIGRFGSLLDEAGIERNVYGHSDTIDEQTRYGSLLVMDEQGKVSGELTGAVKENPVSSYGVEMDIDYLINKLSRESGNSSFTVVEWGDFYRLFKQQENMEDTHFRTRHQQELRRISLFVERVLLESTMEEVWLLAPMMNKKAIQNKQQLAPVYYWGDRNGFLTSDTTRRPYLVSNHDFIPTILQSFGLYKKSEWIGHVMVTEQHNDQSKTHFLNRVEEIFFIYKSRASVLSTYITCLVLALISAAVINFLVASKRKTWHYVIRILLLSALWSPFWFLALSPFIMKLGVVGFVLTLLFISVTCGYIVQKISKRPIFWIGLITYATITVDLAFQSPLIERSYLGYDPIIGARYYGIGNEFAGIYVICALMTLYPLLTERRKWLRSLSCLLMLVLLVIVLGKSTLGTNAGAMLSACTAFSFLSYKVTGLHWSSKRLFFFTGTGMIVGLLVLYILQLGAIQTHIGIAFSRLLDGDLIYIMEVISRKFTMNLKLFRFSNWTQLLVTSYLLGAVALWRKQLQLRGKEKQLFLQTGVVASFALLLLNDSGVVAAATSMFCVVSTYYYWLLLHGDSEKEDPPTPVDEE